MDGILLTNDQYFELKLVPAINRLRGYRPKVKLVEATVGGNGAGFSLPEYLLYGTAREFKAGPIGLDPTNLRASCQDNADQMAQFLQTCATGKLHISCWQYLIGLVTQVEFRAGKRPTYGSFIHRGDGQKAKTATEKIMEGIDQNIAVDADHERVAKKRNFDEKFREKIMRESGRAYLLEKKPS